MALGTNASSIVLEVCVDSIESATNAMDGGARRLELCSALGEGGLTPTIGLLKTVQRIRGDRVVPMMCLIRCRAGGFVYSSEEVRLMQDDISALKEAGADGFVIGALTKNGHIDVEACVKLRMACGDLPVTFHRAFDYSNEPLLVALEKIKYAGCIRLLTSGRHADIIEGLSTLVDLCAAGRDRGITVMPGGGVRVENIALILQQVQPLEIHMSASREIENLPGMGTRKVVDIELVSRAISYCASQI
ncbi:copper homeostasis protein cutC-like [Tropilaelaps mercedesae]|uniref:Copper homeostasis protein cutC homolog n=1 Tax=Tropilaelaps mercedesae TaxID=418985 RepID=A0A1V9XYY6_9ACAR|nr:copper homeostasis protein cutC-like [Tropilaelaps mercedesae]